MKVASLQLEGEAFFSRFAKLKISKNPKIDIEIFKSCCMRNSISKLLPCKSLLVLISITCKRLYTPILLPMRRFFPLFLWFVLPGFPFSFNQTQPTKPPNRTYTWKRVFFHPFHLLLKWVWLASWNLSKQTTNNKQKQKQKQKQNKTKQNKTSFSN